MQGARGFEEFVAVIEEGSVTGAAERLQLPRPTVSRRLAKLEERLGVRLLHRTTRRVAPTPQGQVLYERARRLVADTREAADAVRRLDDVPRGLLRVSVPVGVHSTSFPAWVAEFLAAYPEVTLEVVGTSVHVDLIAEGFDVALRRGQIDDGSLISRVLVADDTIAVASGDYLRRAGAVSRVDQLQHHACIVGFRAGTMPQVHWPLLDGGQVAVRGVFKTNEMAMRARAAVEGVGIGLVSKSLVAPELADGTLEHVLPTRVGTRERVSLVYPDREFLDPKVRAFVDLVVRKTTARRRRRS